MLGERIRVVLRDSAGNAVPGVPVVFTASPGAAVERADGETDESGEASAAFRLPAGEMVALATASAARQVVTFQAKSAASSLRNFPKMKQNLDVPLGNGRATIAERGALLAGLANMIRYHQDRAELPAPNGLAEVAGLNAFLTNSCVARASGGENLCDGFLTPGGEEQLVNVWRVPAFVGGGAEIEAGAGLETVRDWVAAGWPVLVSLRMTAEGAAAGMHHVVATGVMASGAIESFDAGSYFGRGSVDEYLREFSVGGRVWKGEVASVVRLALKPAATAGFVVRSAGALAVSGPAGACGVVLDWQDKAATATSGEARRYVQAGCDGAAARYQAVTAGLAAVELTGLAAPVAESRAEGVKTYGIGEGPGWRVQAQRLTLDAGVVNAANGMPEIGPGSLVALTGTGLWGDGMEVAALVGGLKAAVVEPGPFRINVAIPPESYAGTRVVSLESALGYVELPLELDEAAPAIFEGAGGPVVRNESGAMATAMKPVVRGRPMRVYATGLGLVAGGQAERAVTVSVGGVDVKPEAVANVVGMAGVYEVTVVVPAGTAPAAGVAVALKQAGRESKTVWIAVE